MSITAMQHVKSLNVRGSRRLILMAIADHANAKSGMCWASRRLLAQDAGVSEATAKRAFAWLESEKLIKRTPRIVGGKQSTNVFEIVGFGPSSHRDSKCAPVGLNVNPEGAQSATPGGGLTAEPPIEPSLEPLVEPSFKPVATTRKKTTSGNDYWSSAIKPPPNPETEPHAGATIDARGTITLHNGTGAHWLAKFGGDEERLALALEQAAGWVQPNSSRPLEAQVGSQLAKQLAEKRDRDDRYAAAAKAKQQAKPRALSRFGAAP